MAPTSDKHADGQQGFQPVTGNDLRADLQRPASLKQTFEQTFGLLLAQTRTTYPSGLLKGISVRQ